MELQPYLKFNLLENNNEFRKYDGNYDILFFHENSLSNKQIQDSINKCNLIKILVSNKNYIGVKYDAILKIPTTINDINSIIENAAAKKIFSENSSIKVKKEYILDKNEKKLVKKNEFVILTEKEIQLLELFFNSSKPISKNEILSLVWKYASDVDTHTVETHIYRLRKKIHDKFIDEKFILNDKDGYYL